METVMHYKNHPVGTTATGNKRQQGETTRLMHIAATMRRLGSLS
jgi:hypothetical protein